MTPLREFEEYTLLGEIAGGGMGVVYQAIHRGLNRPCALKLIRTGLLASADERRRFVTEAEAAAKLDHSNIVRVGRAAEFEGQWFLEMELVEGGTLADRIAEGPLALKDTAQLVERLARAVQHAHERGILHRDLKPGNVLLAPDGQPKLTDFGLARFLEKDSDLTRTVAVLGTPAYLAPELASGHAREATIAADIYSLGVILYECLTGQRPFRGQTPLEILRAVQEATAARPSSLRSDVPADLETICLKCLEKEPAKRYATARDLADELNRFLHDEPIHARPVGRVEKAWRWCRRKPALAASLAALMLALTFGIAGILTQWRRAEHQRARAELQSQRAEANATNERRERYYASIAAADSHIRNGDIDVALNVLTNCPPELRHWEWGRLLYLCHQSVSTIQLRLPDYDAGPLIVNGDGSRVAFYRSERVSQAYCWDIHAGRELFTFGAPTNAVLAMAFSPDGRRIAMARLNGLVKIWDAEMGEERTQFSATNRIESLRFNGDATRLAVTTIDRRGSLWDASTGQLLFTTPAADGPLRTSALDPTGRFWATMDDANAITLREARTGQPRYTVQGHADVNPMSTFNLPTLLFSPDGKRFVAHALAEVAKVWNVEDGRELAVIPSRVHDAAFSPDGQRVAIFSGNKTAEVWDLVGGRKVRTLPGHRSAVNAIAFGQEGRRIVTVSDDGILKTWNASFGRELLNHPFYTDDVAFSPDGRRLITTQFDGLVRIWETASGREQFTFRGNWNWLRAVNFSPDGKRIVTGGADRLARIFEADTGRESVVMKGHTSAVRAAAFSPDGSKVATASYDTTAKLWDASTGQELFTLAAHTEPVRSLEFTPDGRRLITGGHDAGAHVWEVDTGRHLFKLSEGSAFSLAISRDGRRIASGSMGKSIRIWDRETGQMLAKWSTRDKVQALDFSPDGKRLIVAASDSIGTTAYPSLEICDVETGRQVLVFQGHANLVFTVKFSPDGRQIASSSFDRVARLWETFPWEESAYPAIPDAPLLSRISAYVESYWRDRLAAERSRRSDEADAPPDSTSRVRLATSAATNPPLPEPPRFPRSAWPARDPNAHANLIDLTAHYNALLNVPWRLILNESDYDNDLSTLPTGIVTLSNVTFDVRGMVRLNPADRTFPYEGERNFFSDAVKNIPANARFRRFHLFHGAQGSAPEGVIICHYVLRYADGSERQIPVINGRDVRDWRELDSDNKPGSDRGIVVWRGTNPPILEQNGRLRLYLTTFENPEPEAEVKTIDIISTRTRCASFLIALTIEL